MQSIVRKSLNKLPLFATQSIRSIETVSGGCINQSFHVSTETDSYFIKMNDAGALPMFLAEQHGLALLQQYSQFRVPTPLACEVMDGQSVLVLEYLRFSRTSIDEEVFAEQLFQMHTGKAPLIGLDQDNFIGETEQINSPHPCWWEFFQRCRLQTQVQWLTQKTGIDFVGLSGELLAFLPELEAIHQPQIGLLHGDLWSGNWSAISATEIAMYDPAVYFGDGLTDIAMMQLFGGCSERFYQHYFSLLPPVDDLSSILKLYQLYHILNHANLFGGGYIADARHRIEALTKYWIG